VNAQPYLSFNGRCEEALKFYHDAVGAETVFLMRFKDGPPKLIPPGGEELIYHATMRIGDSVLNLNDDLKCERGPFGGFAMLLHADTEGEAELFFTRLREGGAVLMQMTAVPWASRYGIIKDKFGMVWKVQSGGA